MNIVKCKFFVSIIKEIYAVCIRISYKKTELKNSHLKKHITIKLLPKIYLH